MARVHASLFAALAVAVGAGSVRAEPVQFCGQPIDATTTEIECKDKSITDLSPLAGATGLVELDLIGTAATDLTPLAGLTKLEELNLRNSKVTKLAPLAKLASLRKLYLGATPVTDLKPLRGLPLEKIELAATSVTDVTPLAAIGTLMDIDLSFTKKLKKVRVLGKLKNLDQVDLRTSSVPKAEAQALGKVARHVYWGQNGEGHFGKR